MISINNIIPFFNHAIAGNKSKAEFAGDLFLFMGNPLGYRLIALVGSDGYRTKNLSKISCISLIFI